MMIGTNMQYDLSLSVSQVGLMNLLFDPLNLVLELDQADRLCDVCILHTEQMVHTKIQIK